MASAEQTCRAGAGELGLGGHGCLPHCHCLPHAWQLRGGRLLSRGKQQIFQEERHSCWGPASEIPEHHNTAFCRPLRPGRRGGRGGGGGISPLGTRSNTAFQPSSRCVLKQHKESPATWEAENWAPCLKENATETRPVNQGQWEGLPTRSLGTSFTQEMRPGQRKLLGERGSHSQLVSRGQSCVLGGPELALGRVPEAQETSLARPRGQASFYPRLRKTAPRPYRHITAGRVWAGPGHPPRPQQTPCPVPGARRRSRAG